MSEPNGDDAAARQSRPRKKLWPWGGKMIHNIVDKDMIKSYKDSAVSAMSNGVAGSSNGGDIADRSRGSKPGLKDRLAKFIQDFKDVMSYDPVEVHAAMSGDLTREELLRASAHVQNVHKFNVLGCGYMQLEEKYSKGEVLGHGGFATVYEVTDIKTGAIFACKEIAKLKLFKSGMKQLLETEIKAMQKLEGVDNVLQLHDTFEDPTHLFMILELCRGGDVIGSLSAKHVDKGSYSEASAASIMSMMVSAVNSCHSRGVLHRDIKPENFLWTDKSGTGKLKLADFGLAAIQGDDKGRIVDMCGTAPYMAPEVWKKESYSTSPDIWALGITMAVLLTGDPPFDADSPSELADVVCNQELDMDQAPWMHLSEGARDLVSRFLEKDPSKRISIKEAMEHPWLNGAAPATSLNSNALSGMQRITEMNQLHRAILTLLARAAVNSSVDESMSLQEKLSKCDTDGSGEISVTELKAALEGTSYDVTDKDTEWILDVLDTDNDGKISYEQFLVCKIHMLAQEAEDTEPLAQAFEMLDNDGDGSVSMQELCQSLKEADIPCTKELGDIFRALDEDDQGRVSLQEFLSFWKENLDSSTPCCGGGCGGAPSSAGGSSLQASVDGSAIYMPRYSYVSAASSAKKIQV